MSSQQIATNRESAEVYNGEALCKQKSKELLEKIALPKGLLPLDDLLEVGYNQATGFIWLRQKNKKDHTFRRIGRRVSYDAEVTAFAEGRRLRRLTGVKSKEFLFWVSISDIYIDDPASGKITFGTPPVFPDRSPCRRLRRPTRLLTSEQRNWFPGIMGFCFLFLFLGENVNM